MQAWEQPWAGIVGLVEARGKSKSGGTNLVDHADNEALLFYLVALDGVVILENLAYGSSAGGRGERWREGPATERNPTGVDELLSAGLPALLFRDLLLDRGHLRGDLGQKQQLWQQSGVVRNEQELRQVTHTV